VAELPLRHQARGQRHRVGVRNPSRTDGAGKRTQNPTRKAPRGRGPDLEPAQSSTHVRGGRGQRLGGPVLTAEVREAGGLADRLPGGRMAVHPAHQLDNAGDDQRMRL
jgi:hypothetical protein